MELTQEDNIRMEKMSEMSDCLRPQMKPYQQKVYDRMMAEGLEFSAWRYKMECVCDAKEITLYVPELGDVKLLRWKSITGQRFIYAPSRDLESISILCINALKEHYGVNAGFGFPAPTKFISPFWSRTYNDWDLVYYDTLPTNQNEEKKKEHRSFWRWLFG